jgi:hypothetical protein
MKRKTNDGFLSHFQRNNNPKHTRQNLPSSPFPFPPAKKKKKIRVTCACFPAKIRNTVFSFFSFPPVFKRLRLSILHNLNCTVQ